MARRARRSTRRRARRGYFRLSGRRRNPAAAPRIALFRPGTWAPLVATGAVAGTVTVTAPRVLMGPKVQAPTAYLVQAAVGVLGGFAVGWFLRPLHGFVWTITSGAAILMDSIGKSLAEKYFPRVSAYPGLGAAYYPTAMAPVGGGVGTRRLSAYPRSVGRFGPA